MGLLYKEKNKIIYLLGDFKYDLLSPYQYVEIYLDFFYTMGYLLLINKPTIEYPPIFARSSITFGLIISSAILAELVCGHFDVMQCTFVASKKSTQEPNSHSRLFNQNTIKLIVQ